ncbi:SDR family NAD(P)-dependent oxidoreductase [Streptomyces sp. NPDC086091]|uniref:SDR family NAD(P)-dependent oxidoreductase n=1 Tax=Streptomyces sp. NPDC086091 TaxID=3365751 RepID=UPI00382A5021
MITRQPERDLHGRTIIVTGASSGIGAAAARGFAARGATVVVVGRSAERTGAVAQEIGGHAFAADYARLDDVRRLADDVLARHPRVDVLVNNAGAFFAARRLSTDGYELTFQVNHLAPFLLTNLLLERLSAAPLGGRVVNLTSRDHGRGSIDVDRIHDPQGRYRWRSAYASAKLATVLFTRELSRRAEGTGLTASALHPGLVATDISRDVPAVRAFMGSRLVRATLHTPDQGAEPLLRLATTVGAAEADGQYFDRFTPKQPLSPQATDPYLARQLWDRSVELTGIRSTGA